MTLISSTRTSVNRLLAVTSTRGCNGSVSIHDSLPRTPIKLSPDVARNLEDGVYGHRRHAGRFVRNLIALPDRFRRAATELLSKAPGVRPSSETVVAFSRYLANRKPATEVEALRKKAMQMEKDLLPERTTGSSDKDVESNDKALILNKLRKTVYHWQPINYSDGMAATYLCARAAPDFAVLTQIFLEIKLRSPAFVPKGLLDFGSGVGMSIWAADNVWPSNIKEYFAVDCSSEMSDLARLLMQDGLEGRPPFIRGTYFRKCLPAAHALRYDLVVSAFSLMELPTATIRRQVIENLWNKTEDYLVIVETGSNAGFGLVMEARSHLLHLAAKSGPGSVEVFAPCSHSLGCPRLAKQEMPCNFQVCYEPLFASRGDAKFHDRFSYVVLRKRRTETEESHARPCWPRIVSEVLVRPRHVVCRICDSNGRLGEVVVTASKDGRDLYRCVRACRWGDLLPVTNTSVDEGSQNER